VHRCSAVRDTDAVQYVQCVHVLIPMQYCAVIRVRCRVLLART
jgi:hypothetical protein